MFYTIQIVNRQNSYIVTSRFNDSILILHNRYIYLHFYKDILFFHNIKNENTYLWFVYSKEILILFVFRDRVLLNTIVNWKCLQTTEWVFDKDRLETRFEFSRSRESWYSRVTWYFREPEPTRSDPNRTEPNRVSGTRDFRILAHL